MYGKPSIFRVLDRCIESGYKVVVTIPFHDHELEELIHSQYQVHVYRGPENDLIRRFDLVVQKQKPDYLCRVTGDCPLISVAMLNYLIRYAEEHKFDYVTNIPGAVNGSDIQVMSRNAFNWIKQHSISHYDREHVGVILQNPKIFEAFLNNHSYYRYEDPYNNCKFFKQLSLDDKTSLRRIKKHIQRMVMS